MLGAFPIMSAVPAQRTRTMARWIGVAALFLTSCTSLWGASDEEGFGAVGLRCEHRRDPMGIDAAPPLLSWKLVEPDPRVRGQVQIARQILVASSPEILAEGRGDLWDSGRVVSDRTRDVEYGGRKLVSGQRCFWKVRVWDREGRPSAWSEPARWSMGLLDPSDWKARWIGHDAPLQREDELPRLDGAQWIWLEADPPLNAPAGQRAFSARWDLPDDLEIEGAQMVVTVDDRLELFVNGRAVRIPSSERHSWKTVSVVDLRELLRPGANELGILAENVTQGPAGLIARLVVTTSSGEGFELVTDDDWLCTDEVPEDWRGEAPVDAPWPACRILVPFGAEPWGQLEPGGLFLPPPRYLRTEFAARAPVSRATLYASALGLYEVHLNGERVGEDSFTPGWTDYEKRVYYNTYDATELVREGANGIGAVLADGWYAGHVGFGHRRHHYGEKTRALVQLEIEYEDGTRETVASGADWKTSLGPLLEADLLMGEAFDARREMPGWDRAGFDDSDWQPVEVGAEHEASLEPYPAQTAGPIATFEPVEITEPLPGTWVLDLGQNFAGVVRLKVRGEPGQRIVLRHAERLAEDGTIYTENLRAARATDTYVCRGGGLETWQPRFTFHGFQYVEVTGLSEPPTAETITGVALGSRTPPVGRFQCSEPMLEQLFSNIHWTQRMNFIDIPTDCPQRDERLGWTGDAQIYVRTAAALCDVQAFFGKWLVDLADAQREDGQFPSVAPLKCAGSDGGPAWSDAGTICPWTIYEVYGDRRLLARHYEGMKRYLAFCEGRCDEELLPPEKFHCYGDWVNIDADTPKDLIYTAYFAHSARLTARSAEALGLAEEAARYEALFQRIAQAFNQAYVQGDGRIGANTQCGYVLALAFDLVAGERREQAAAFLLEALERRDWHLSTGFVGTKDLMLVLSKIGRDDVAWRLILNRTFPSWGFSIEHGATTIWERWNGWTPEEGFATPGMNSFAHYSFGAVGQWMFDTIGGIDAARPGFDEIRIRPRPGGGLTWAKTRYDSVHGPIATHWRREGGGLRLDVTIPPNTRAVVHVPALAAEGVTEGGEPVERAEGLKPLGFRDGAAVFEVGSGRYSFRSRVE